MNLFLDENLDTTTLVLNNIIDAEITITEATYADVYFIYQDEPTATPEFLATIAAGSEAKVPFPESKRPIRLFAISKDAENRQSVTDFAKAETYDYSFPDVSPPSGDYAAYELTTAKNGETVINQGATELLVANLPAYETGLSYMFYVADANGIRVKARSGTVISIGSSDSASGGYAQSTTVGSFLKIRAINNKWVAETSTGTWTLT